jgi:chlorobactene glucosyltransferase
MLILVALLLGLLYGQALLTISRAPRLAPAAGQAPPEALVSVIIPARNEAARIERCLAGLAAQSHRRFEVIVVDDQSSDGTGELARSYAGRLPGLSTIDGAPLPEGWGGKCWACWQAFEHAGGDWLLFLDADVAPQPELLAALLAAAERHGRDAISLLPLLETGTFAERLVLPAFFELVGAIYPLDLVNDPRSPLAFAIGQCLLIRRAAYLAVDGHRAVRASVLEDVELAGRLKGAGRRLWVAEAPDLIAVRMYDGWQALAEGLSKNALAGYRSAGARSALVALRQLALGWLPPDLLAAALAYGLSTQLLALGGLALALSAVAAGWNVRRRFRLSPLWGLLLPIGTLAYFVIAARAALAVRLGQHLVWKGRRVA